MNKVIGEVTVKGVSDAEWNKIFGQINTNIIPGIAKIPIMILVWINVLKFKFKKKTITKKKKIIAYSCLE